MIGIDDLAISLAISYIADNIPQLHSWFEGNPSLKKEIDKCYEQALKQWTVNSGIREIERGHAAAHFSELKQLLAGEALDDKGHLELVRLWVQEMKSNEICYNFILEHKSDLRDLKLEGGFKSIAHTLQEGIEDIRSFRLENRTQLQQMMSALDEIKSSLGSTSDEEIAGKVQQLISGVVAEMIESLRLDTAGELIVAIEGAFGSLIKKYNDLEVSVLTAKGDSLLLSEPQLARESYHKAYSLKPDNERLKAIEIGLLRRDDLGAAMKLANQLPEYSLERNALKVYCSDDPERAYKQLPDVIKNDYSLRYNVSLLLSEKNVDVSFLYEDDVLREETSLNFKNLPAWIYMITWHSMKVGVELRIASPRPVQPEVLAAFKMSHKFIDMLQETEVRPLFSMAEAHCFYWGYMIDENPEWINKIHQLDRNVGKEQVVILNMLEISMLVMAKRFPEAFQMMASMREDISPNIAEYIILVGSYSNDMKLIGWVMDLIKEKTYKLGSSAALHIASCVSPATASELLQMLNDEAFENENDAVILRELCLSYAGKDVDVEKLKTHLEDLSDDMIAYAALVLSKAGEAQMAFGLLRPKVEDGNSDLRQRIFFEIMSALPEKHPELYSMLVKNRKDGNPCDDGLLGLEYSLDTRIGDFENAFEAISILYEKRPKEESVLVNYLRMLGRFDTKRLEEKGAEVLSYRFAQLVSVKQVYQIYLENKYVDIAAEILYKHVSDSSDIEARTFYYYESITGGLGSIVNQQFPVAKEGLYAVCDRGDGERRFFKVELGTEIGETLMGLKEGDRFVVKEDGLEGEYVIMHIVNKYGRLAAEISLEVTKGENPHFQMLQIDMERPLESLLEQLAIVSPDSANYSMNARLAEEKYEKGEIGILNLVRDDDLIGDYYCRLFSSSKVYVAPCQVLDSIVFHGSVPVGTRFVLDITGLLALFEYSLKTDYQFQEKFIIPTTTYEFVVATCKNCGRLSMHSYSEALSGGAIVKFKSFIDMDLEIRMSKLLKWIDDNCEKEVPDKFLSLGTKEQNSHVYALTMNTLTLMLKPGRCLISDDQIIEKKFRLKARVITTEAFMLKHNNGKDYADYVKYLADCNYIGVFLNDGFVYDEYMKMERGQENKFAYITQNAAYNEVLVSSIIQAALRIAADARDKKLVALTLINLFAVMIKAIKPKNKSYLVTTIMESLPMEFSNSRMVRQCLLDAARINNVILLPGSFRL